MYIIKTHNKMNDLKKTNILGTQVTAVKKDTILEYLVKNLDSNGDQVTICTPNPEIIAYAKSHTEFQSVLNTFDIALPDGIGVALAARIMRKGKVDRIAGVDFMLDLVSLLSDKNEELKNDKNDVHKKSKKPYGIGLFGGQPGIAELTADCLQKKYSGTHILYTGDTWNEHKLKGKRLSVLFVALGHPKQEEWIMENKNKIPADIIMTVGGSFDFISERVRRAPLFVRKLGLEWLFRLLNQPWRWKRQLALITFIKEVAKEAI